MSFEDLLKQGEALERYVVIALGAEGIVLGRYDNRDDQWNYGDLYVGEAPNINNANTNIEVKYDRRYHQTGNLFIEVGAKIKKSESIFKRGGIMASANWSWLITGDYRDLFMFKRIDLKRLYDEHERKNIKEISAGTGRGFLLSPSQILQFAVKEWHWPHEEPVRPPKKESLP